MPAAVLATIPSHSGIGRDQSERNGQHARDDQPPFGDGASSWLTSVRPRASGPFQAIVPIANHIRAFADGGGVVSPHSRQSRPRECRRWSSTTREEWPRPSCSSSHAIASRKTMLFTRITSAAASPPAPQAEHDHVASPRSTRNEGLVPSSNGQYQPSEPRLRPRLSTGGPRSAAATLVRSMRSLISFQSLRARPGSCKASRGNRRCAVRHGRHP